MTVCDVVGYDIDKDKCNERQKKKSNQCDDQLSPFLLSVNTYLTMAGNHVHRIPSADKAVFH